MDREPMDEGDVAADYQARHNAAALADHRAKMVGQATAPSLEICEDCGDEIPPERREKQPGCTRCIDCQRVHERLKGGM
ncbi:MAG: TraR/DksA C4-type zinc finger protein [Desulfobulbia bacterium]